MTTVRRPVTLPEEPPTQRILPLANGDNLTREEFERRYEAMPGIKAELIDGVVYMASPVNHAKHGQPHGKLTIWSGTYAGYTPGVELGDNSTLKLDAKSQPQPDVFLYVLPSHGGATGLDDEGYFTGAPEWLGEVAASSASYDLHQKLQVYRRNGVKEYVVWRVVDRTFDWFVLRGDQYERLPCSADGYFRSEVFPGLWLDPQALIAQDTIAVLNVLQLGLASVEHAQFVERLARRREEIAHGHSA